jgi:hypothetical protein
MRLAQLARKLVIRPTVIVEFLIEHNIQIEDGSNTRLEDDHVALIMQKFAPARAAEIAAELVIEKEIELKDTLPEEKVEIIAHSAVIENSIPFPSEESLPEKIEVIKAPKIELSGLKVLGKIELPEPKKKEVESIDEQSQVDQPIPAEVEKKPRTENRKPYTNRKETSNQRPEKNPIAIERERNAFEAEKKKRAQLKHEKEKRTQHYLSKVKVVAPTKSVKLVKEEVEELTPMAPTPKTVWGKFMKWLNT